MTTNPISLDPSHTISDVRTVFQNHRIHHIPIVQENKLMGMVSKSDYLFFRRGFTENVAEEKIERLRLGPLRLVIS